MATTASALRKLIEENGYVVVPTGIPAEQLRATAEDIWRHVGADPSDRGTWYPKGIASSAGMVEMYQYQSMWDNRQHPGIHAAFADILGTERLWVTLDRANFKPPADPAYPHFDFKGFIHWDTDITRHPDIHFSLQGVLAITDTDETMGGFQCCPDLYRDLGPYLERRRAAGADLRRVDTTGYTVTPVRQKAGDLVIWSTLLPHGNGENRSDRPRLAQYISMHRAGDIASDHIQRRVHIWQHNEPPGNRVFPGDARHIEEQRTAPSHLTPLGRKLLGADAWD